MTGMATGEQDTAVAFQKAALRARMLASRRLIPEQSRAEMSHSIAGHVLSLPEILTARSIHLYLSIPVHAEVDTAPIIEGLGALGKAILVPVIRDGKLFSAAFRKGDPLLPGQFGQPEPEAVSIVEESYLDVVLMPLLAFDGSGYRLGYGKGYYDFFLQRLSKQGRNPCRIGLSFSQQMVDEIPANEWDEVLDGVVHEQGIMRFSKS